MAAIDWTAVIAHAPELAAVSSQARTEILAHVNTALDVEVFGGEDAPKTRLARIYLAAHLGAGVANSGGSTSVGAVTSESAGGLSRSYGQAAVVATASLGSTSYGQAYLALVNTSAARAPFVP